MACVTLPRAYAPVSIPLGVIRTRKPPHPQHVLEEGRKLPQIFKINFYVIVVIFIHLVTE
jgi:hypothetical protein